MKDNQFFGNGVLYTSTYFIFRIIKTNALAEHQNGQRVQARISNPKYGQNIVWSGKVTWSTYNIPVLTSSMYIFSTKIISWNVSFIANVHLCSLNPMLSVLLCILTKVFMFSPENKWYYISRTGLSFALYDSTITVLI